MLKGKPQGGKPMLEDSSHHVLDIAENSVNAGARNVTLQVEENRRDNRLRLEVQDDGCGMEERVLRQVTDPFYTTRTTRRVGLGLPFLRQAAEACEGKLVLDSVPGRGTRLEADFRWDHVDRPPLGDLPATLMTLLMGHPEIRWIYRHRVDDREYVLDSRDLLEVLEDPELFRTPEVGLWIRDHAREGIEGLYR